MTLLLTGFPSFAGVERNPSEQIVAALGGSAIGGLEVVGRVLPVSAERTPGAVRAAIAETSPSARAPARSRPGRVRGSRSSAWRSTSSTSPIPTTTARSPLTSRSSPVRPSRTSRPCRSGASSRPGKRPASRAISRRAPACFSATRRCTPPCTPPPRAARLRASCICRACPRKSPVSATQPSMALATQIEGVRLALEESVAALAA